MPTFQRRNYALRAVASVFAQTLEDFELIVVDDGSTDGTGAALAGLDGRVRYQWQENRGTGAARNTGVRLARAEIVAFLDSDNRWLPHHLEIVTEVLERFPEAVLACTCFRQHIAGRQRPRDARLVDFLPLAYSDAWAGLISCMGMRRSELLSIQGFDERLGALEDVELCLRLAARGPFAFLQHRTIIHQATRGSRLERGCKSGAMLDAFETISRVGLEVVQNTQRDDRAKLLALAEGRLHYSAALRALVEGDDDGVRKHLQPACALLPDLSKHPEVVARRITRIAQGPGVTDGARCLAAAATLWPDQRSDTALFLRLKATVAALRARRPREAGRLLRRWRMPSRLLGRLGSRCWASTTGAGKSEGRVPTRIERAS